MIIALVSLLSFYLVLLIITFLVVWFYCEHKWIKIKPFTAKCKKCGKEKTYFDEPIWDSED